MIGQFNILSWAGGIIDAEGCIQIGKRPSTHCMTYHLMVSVTNCDKAMIEVLQQDFGGTATVMKKRNPQHRQALSWSLHCKKAEFFLRLIEPHLRCKKQQAQLALEYRDTYDEERSGRRNWAVSKELQERRELYRLLLQKMKRKEMQL